MEVPGTVKVSSAKADIPRSLLSNRLAENMTEQTVMEQSASVMEENINSSVTHG